MAYEAFSETSPIDGKAVRTIAAMVARPGRLLNSYRVGASSLYATPIKIFVVMTALFLAVLNFSSVEIYQYVRELTPGVPLVATADPNGYDVHVTGTREVDLWMQRRREPAVDPGIITAIQAAAARATNEADRQNLIYELQSYKETEIVTKRLSSWLPNAIWLLMPLYAALLAPLFGRKRLFMEHVVFAMWAHAMAFALLMLLALANRIGANMTVWPMAPAYLLYFTVTAARYYDVSHGAAAWRAMVHLAAYLFLVLLPAAFIVALTAMDWTAFSAFMRA